MKYVLIFAIVALLAWRWRSSRIRPPSQPGPDSRKAPINMCCCGLCGLHIPVADAAKGKSGVYCCQEHLRQAED